MTTPPPEAEPERRPRRRWLRWLIVVACLCALIWTVARLGPGEVLRVARQADPLWLTLSVVPLCGRFLIWGYKWRGILRRQFDAPYWRSLRILIAGSFVNLTTPTAKLAGGVLRAALLRQHYGGRLSVAYGRAFADQTTNVLGTVVVYGVLAISAFIATDSTPAAFPISGAIILLGLGFGIALRGWAWNQTRQPWLVGTLRKLTPRRFRSGDGKASWIEPVFYPLLGEGSARTTMLRDIGFGALSFASLCLANALVLRSLGVETNLWLLAALVAPSYFLGAVIGTWGGIGVTEAALTALYIQFDVPAEIATAAALLHRAAFYILVLTAGGLSLWKEGRPR